MALSVVVLESACAAGPAQLTVSAPPAFTTIIQGYVDPVPTKVSNVAPAGSDAGNYSVTLGYPGTTIGPVTGSVNPGLSTTYAFAFDSTGATPGPNTVTATLTDTTSNAVSTSSSVVTVLARSKPAFFINGNQVPMSAVPISKAQALQLTPDFGDPSAGAGIGSDVALAAPNVGGDPPPLIPTDELDLDSITPIGDPQISMTLQPFTDLPPDDPADDPPYQFVVDTTVPGSYYTDFELNYSDEQDLPARMRRDRSMLISACSPM